MSTTEQPAQPVEGPLEPSSPTSDATAGPVLEVASVAAPRPELDWERDGGGRPRIMPDPTWTPEWVERWADGRANDAGEVPYTRVTTFAEALQDSSALTKWKLRRAILGMGRRPDYVTAAAALSIRDDDRDALNDLAEKALEAAGPNAADIGTALHSFTERLDRGEDVGVVPPEYQSSVEAYRRVVSHLRFVEFECRTVCDDLETAGTPDRYGFCDVPDPDGRTDLLRVIDTKTGRVDYSAGKFSTQLAIYAHSRLYHPGTGARLKLEERHGAPLSTKWGLIVHTPAGAGTAELLWIDLEHGWKGAQQCRATREWRTGARAGLLLRPVFARAPRPATTDGTCRGRRAGDGGPCGYRAKLKQEDPHTRQFCGRHQDQAKDLERWLAENPEADPTSGVDDAPAMDPVVITPPEVVAAEVAVAAGAEPVTVEHVEPTAQQQEAYLAGVLISPRTMPNGHVMAPVGAVAMSPDGVRWVKVQRTDTYGWEREADVLEAGGADTLRCRGTGLLVKKCHCPVHDPKDADLAAAAFERARAASAITPDPERPVPSLELGTTAAALQRDQEGDEAALHEDLQPVATLPDGLSDQQRADLSAAAANRADDAYRQQLQDQRDAAVGTYALDPDVEQNGNPRPVSGLQTPAAAGHSGLQARMGILAELNAAQSEDDLLAIFRRSTAWWDSTLTRVAGERSAELQRLARTARPEAALIAALQTAPDALALGRLFAEYGSTEFWTPEAAQVAQAAWDRLAG